MLATCCDEFFIKDEMLPELIGIMICFLEGPLVVDWSRGFCWFFPLMMLLTWSIFLAFKDGNASLIFKTSDEEEVVLDAWVYDRLFWELKGFEPLFFSELSCFLVWKYLEMTFTSYFDFAGRGGGGGALLTVTGTDLGGSFLELPFGGGTCGVNFDEIFALRVLVFLSVYSASHLEAYTEDMKFQMESPIPSKS